MSGRWTGNDRVIVRDNIIRGNNYLQAASFRGGIGISTANDIVFFGNSFGTKTAAGVNIIFAASRTPPQPDARGVSIERSVMNGDLIVGAVNPRHLQLQYHWTLKGAPRLKLWGPFGVFGLGGGS